ncbi:MAG: VWA domain-containing protein [Pseudomonadales bacterium]
MIEFAWPWAFAFMPLPILVYYLLPSANRHGAALHVPFYGLVASYESEVSAANTRSWIRRILMMLAWLALVLAAARPQWIGDPVELPATGRDLMLAVDISGSMGTEDMELNNARTTRLAAVKNVVGDFVERRKGDRLGLILFGTRAYMQTPLTFDRNTVRTLLEETPLGIAGGKTAIGDAIGLAVKRLKSRPTDSRVLILLTDGVSNVGEVSPLQAARLAAAEGIKIYTIGFGADELVVPGLLFKRRVNPSADLDTETLTEIARITSGVYHRARSTGELASVYRELDKLEPIDQDLETWRPINALFYWPLGFAFVASLLLAALHPLVTSWIMARFIRSADDTTEVHL